MRRQDVAKIYNPDWQVFFIVSLPHLIVFLCVPEISVTVTVKGKTDLNGGESGFNNTPVSALLKCLDESESFCNTHSNYLLEGGKQTSQ